MDKQGNQIGLCLKYDVIKVETGEKVNNCFVLRPDKDPAAVTALRAYARKTPNKALADDIIAWIGAYEQDKSRLAEVCDAVNHPAHYTQGGIECIEALKAATEGLEGIEAVCTANAVKYLWRWKHKGGVQDLDKAIWYIKRLKEEVEGK